MPARRTTLHLLTAIYEGLTTSTGKTRALGAADLFQRGYSPSFDRRLRSIRARPLPGVHVHFRTASVSDGLADELGSEHLYRMSVQISRDYFLPFEHDRDALDEVSTRAFDHFMLIRAALCYPGALDETAGAEATGLADNGLIAPDAMAELRVEQIQSGNDRLVNVVDTFGVAFLFDPDA